MAVRGAAVLREQRRRVDGQIRSGVGDDGAGALAGIAERELVLAIVERVRIGRTTGPS
jgi:hypothetical protein